MAGGFGGSRNRDGCDRPIHPRLRSCISSNCYLTAGGSRSRPRERRRRRRRGRRRCTGRDRRYGGRPCQIEADTSRHFENGISTLVLLCHPCFHWLWAETCLAISIGSVVHAQSTPPSSCLFSPSSRYLASSSPKRLLSRSARISLKRTPSPGALPPRSRHESKAT